jgi:RHS repeat-associated protein
MRLPFYTGYVMRAWKDTDSNADVRTYFLYDGGVLLAETDAAGSLTAVNTWGANGLLSRRVGSTTTYYAYDPQGSVAARLNSSQSVVSSDLYDAYGSLLAGGASDPYGYCGQWGYYKDSETGKVLRTYRYYDPSVGRWLTRDPIGYDGGVNLYAYVECGPSDSYDADGLKRARGPGRRPTDQKPRGGSKGKGVGGKSRWGKACKVVTPCGVCLSAFSIPAFVNSPCGRPGIPSWSEWSDCMSDYWDIFLDECKRSRLCMVILYACDVACAGILHGMTEDRRR